MFSIKTCSFFFLLVLGVSAEESSNKETPKTVQTSLNAKKLTKLSEFFIGDLLRTDPLEEQLETSSTVDHPIAAKPQNVLTKDMDNMAESSRVDSNYNTHSLEERIGGRSGPIPNEKYVSEDDMASRRFSRAGEYPRHKPKCKKHHHHESSEEEEYSKDERSPVASPTRDYRTTPSSYYHHPEPEEEHYTSSHGSSLPSRSKSFDSNSQSKSGKSYSTSKSYSGPSKSQNRPEKVHVFDNRKPSHDRDYHHQGHGNGNGGIVVHKVRDTSDSEEEPYSDEGPHRKPNAHSPAQPEREYYQDSPPQSQGWKRPGTPFRASHSQGQEYNHRPSPFRDSPLRKPTFTGPPSHQPQGYSQHSHGSEEPATHHRGNLHSSQPQENIRPQFHNSHLQSSRQRNIRPQPSHNTHPSETGYRSPVQEHKRQIIRPSEATTSDQDYNQTPHSFSGGNGNFPAGWKHSPVPTTRKHHAVQGRNQISITKADSSPSVSRSVSFSQSKTYDVEPQSRTPAKAMPNQQQPRMFGEPQKMINSLLLNSEQGRGYETPFKPFNSEHPSSFFSGQVPLNGQRNFRPLSFQGPHHAFDGSHSSYDGPQYNGPHQPYDSPDQPYDGPDQPYDGPSQSYEDSTSQQDDGYSHHDSPKQEGDVTGYKDHYPDSKPLEIDDAFFEKYGISKNAKIIVATAEQPNLFVADGTHLKEGGGGGSSGGYTDEEYRNSKLNIEQGGKRKPLSPISSVPGSFTELVDSNPKFLRQFSATTSRQSVTEDPKKDRTRDELAFKSSLSDPKAFVQAQGTRDIVQKHGNGVSRIIYNKPTNLSKKETTEESAEYDSASESRKVAVLQKPEGDAKTTEKPKAS
ncbi:hypothetical protein JTE90_028021 [Oedothorax gibbosus]|uniref:Uncharacterized protein n=1 Tax=Oedothorax gibbosus TaxID=931172 RepID=A0AAV6VDU0_9ARAC|nr:hypothetical protein JTE90_028021 [Oedothorax gibbosus]